MRAKDEFRNIAANYDTKLILERVVDGTLMCPEACCGAPVVECTCGPDCPHCNCFMIHKAMKEKGFTNKLLRKPKDEDEEVLQEFGIEDGVMAAEKGAEKIVKTLGIGDEEGRELPAGHYDTHVRLRRGGRWNAHTVSVRKTDKELIQKFLDQGFRIVKPFDEDNEEKQKGVDGKACWKGYRREGTKMKGGKRVDNCVKVEDNEEPKRGITGLNPRRSPELHSMKSHAIDKIDLNKWREYPAEDVMKAVYRRYGKELPSVDSYDWAITWDKKVRPWLKEHEGTF